MKYMLLIHHNEKTWGQHSEGERKQIMEEYFLLTQRLKSSGKHLGSAPLHPTATATSIRVRDGKRLVTDGPFAETREQLGGYYLVEAGNLDEVIDIAAQVPTARTGTVEIRPVIEIAGLPTD